MDLKALLQRYLPEQRYLREHRHLRFFGPYLRQASLWRLNRHSAARGVAIGLFVAFIPLPVHTLLTATSQLAPNRTRRTNPTRTP